MRRQDTPWPVGRGSPPLPHSLRRATGVAPDAEGHRHLHPRGRQSLPPSRPARRTRYQGRDRGRGESPDQPAIQAADDLRPTRLPRLRFASRASSAMTNAYAEVDLKMKAKALANREVDGQVGGRPRREDSGLVNVPWRFDQISSVAFDPCPVRWNGRSLGPAQHKHLYHIAPGDQPLADRAAGDQRLRPSREVRPGHLDGPGLLPMASRGEGGRAERLWHL